LVKLESKSALDESKSNAILPGQQGFSPEQALLADTDSWPGDLLENMAVPEFFSANVI
jgi:hypothetical protein